MLRNFFVICGSVVMGLARFAQGVPGKLVLIRMLQIETSGYKVDTNSELSHRVDAGKCVFELFADTHFVL